MNHLYFTIINRGYINFCVNFIDRCEQIKSNIIDNFLIVCMDQESFSYMSKYTEKNKFIDVQRYNIGVSKNLEKWLTEAYKTIVFTKLDIKKSVLNSLASQYKYITYIDTDMWVNNRFDIQYDKIIQNTDFDLIFQDGEDYLCDISDCSEIIENRLVYKKYCNSFCTGFITINTLCKDKINDLFTYNQNNITNNNGNQEFINKKLYSMDLNVLALPKNIIPNMSQHNYYKSLNNNYWLLHYTYLTSHFKYQYMKINDHWLLI